MIKRKLVKAFLYLFIAFSYFHLSGQAPTSLNMTLHTQWNDPNLPERNGGLKYNDIWGYVDCDDNEYAILGSLDFTLFFDVTDPDQIFEVARFQGRSRSVWRDYKTFKSFAYGVADQGNEGLAIYDLSNLPQSITFLIEDQTDFERAHNIFIDEANGRLYIAGANTQGSGLIVYDLNQDPANPQLLARIDLPGGGYVHDLYVRDNIAYCSHGYEGYYIWDMSDPNNPINLASLVTNGYNHSSWVSEDGQYAFVAEEVPFGLPMLVIDLSQLFTFNQISLAHSFKMPLLFPLDDNVPHNPFVRGNHLIVSYYEDGTQVFDISDPLNPTRTAYYDTEPNNQEYNGTDRNWGVYPFLPSGTILSSDTNNGLFVTSADGFSFSATEPLSSPFVDNDNDGICRGIDCNDFDQNVGGLQPTGTTCNDGISYTINDMILSDGCTCAGEIPDFTCNDYTLVDNDICEVLALLENNGLALEDCDNGGLDNATECAFGGDPNDGSDDALLFTSELGNYVWDDVNLNGIQDIGEQGIENIEIQLFEGDNFQYIKSNYSDVSGFFVFDGLPPGNYYLKFVIPSGYSISPPNQGSNLNQDSDVNDENGIGTTPITDLGMAEVDLGWDLGMNFNREVLSIASTILSGTATATKNIINWEITNKEEIESIILERAVGEANNFENIYRTDNLEINHFIDSDLESNQNYYYRIKTVDLFGVSAYSNIINLASIGPLSKNELSISPNPTNDFISIKRIGDLTNGLNLEILNGAGQSILKIDFTIDQELIKIDLSDYPQGIYYLLDRSNLGLKVQKIVKVD